MLIWTLRLQRINHPCKIKVLTLLFLDRYLLLPEDVAKGVVEMGTG